jgi:hypothetical protein
MKRCLRLTSLLLAFVLLGCPSDKTDWLTSVRQAMHGTARDIDLDLDGRIELHVLERFPDGRPKREEIDYDQNGTTDLWVSFDDTGWLYYEDLDHDGRPDGAGRAWTAPNGQKTRVVVFDSNHDGELDARVSSVWTSSATIVTKVDYLFKGSFWTVRTTTVSEASSVSAAIPHDGPGGPLTIDTDCGAQQDEILGKYAEALSVGRDCLGGISPTLAQDFERAAGARPTTEIVCKPLDPNTCASAPNSSDFTNQTPMRIELNTMPPADCGSQESTLFHEALHYALGPHATDQGRQDLLDQIYACEDFCFGSKSADSCDRCLAQSGGDASDKCSEKSDFHACMNAPKVRCFKCAGAEYDESYIKKGYRCGMCNGMEVLMMAGDRCCGDMICDADQLCGLCGGTYFCSSFADAKYCGKCDGKPMILTAGQQCCTPDNPRWNDDRQQCEADCPGGSEAGGDTPVTLNFELKKNIGSFNFTYDTYVIRDRMIVSYEGTTLYDTGCVGASASVLLDYAGKETFVTVEVQPDCAGETDTAWDFMIACP